MTRISYIHGPVPVDEFQDRAKEVGKPDYINPLVLTDGGMYLRLMRNQVKTLAQYYPEDKKYRKGLSLIDNALHTGIHGPAPYIGAVEPSLYPVMRAIDVYKARRQPAMRQVRISGSWQDESLVAGIGAGEIPQITNELAIWWWFQDSEWIKKNLKVLNADGLKKTIPALESGSNVAEDILKHYYEFRQKYTDQKYIIDLYNDTLQKFAHHPLYNFLPQKNEYPPYVVPKSILHSGGVQAMANVGGWSPNNMSLWTRNAILQENIAGNAGALSPERTAFMLTGLPDEYFTQFIGTGLTGSRDRPGSAKVTGDAAIGILPAVAVAIIGLIAAAVGGAFAYLQSIEQRKSATAMASVQGWGTQAFSASEADWKDWIINPDGTISPKNGATTTTDTSSNMPLLLAAAAGAILLTQD